MSKNNTDEQVLGTIVKQLYTDAIREQYVYMLKNNYDRFVINSVDKFLSDDLTPRGMSADFDGDPGYWWCRHMVPRPKLTGRGVFCIANVTVPESIRGQGVFGEFLDHVISNPHHFTGVEVEAIFNDPLIEYLEGRGFVHCRENSWGGETLRYMYKEH